ncbi:hypothetical protein D9M71_347200 [compost metagenome]
MLNTPLLNLSAFEGAVKIVKTKKAAEPLFLWRGGGNYTTNLFGIFKFLITL